eukprot:550555-Pelagomonas_calceolata.AAC.6
MGGCSQKNTAAACTACCWCGRCPATSHPWASRGRSPLAISMAQFQPRYDHGHLVGTHRLPLVWSMSSHTTSMDI